MRDGHNIFEVDDAWMRVYEDMTAATDAGLAARKTSLLQLIDRQAAMFAEAGPLTVKAQREKLHKLVEEYAGLAK